MSSVKYHHSTLHVDVYSLKQLGGWRAGRGYKTPAASSGNEHITHLLPSK